MKNKNQKVAVEEVADLIKSIKEISGEIKALGRKTVVQYYALGEKLYELKKFCDRTFAKVVNEIGVSRSTAYEYIQLYERAVERYGQETLPSALDAFDSFAAARKGLFPSKKKPAAANRKLSEKESAASHDEGDHPTEDKTPVELKHVTEPGEVASEASHAEYVPPSYGTKVGNLSKWLVEEQHAIVDRDEAVRALQTLIEKAQAVIDKITAEPIMPPAGTGPAETQEASAC